MLLPLLILIPLIGGLLCWKVEYFSIKAPRWISLITVGLTFILSFQIWLKTNNFIIQPADITDYQWKLEFISHWIPRFGINIHLALDGLSLLMITLVALLGILSILCSWNEVKKKYNGLFYCNLMLVIGGIIGVFLAIDMFLFFFFWEVISIPMYFLIVFWGRRDSNREVRIAAATKFFIYAQISSLTMLITILILVLIHYKTFGILTFDYEELLQTTIPYNLEYWLMLFFFTSFAIKIPIVPFHGWLLDAHSQTSTTGSIDLAGFLLKIAVYGLLRFCLPLFPHSSVEFAPIAVWLGVINIFYGSWIAFSQYDIKRLIVYTTISHVGFALIAIYSGSQLGYQGAIMQMITNSLSSAGLFVLSGQLYDRLYTYDMRMMGGLWKKIKWLPALSIFFAAATSGIPGTGNFVTEFMILLGSFKTFPKVTIVSAFSLVFSAIYSLTMIQRIFFGQENNKIIITEELQKVSLRELFISFILIMLLILFGLYPQIILNISYYSMNSIYQLFDSDFITINDNALWKLL